jgi:hypothetical protein
VVRIRHIASDPEIEADGRGGTSITLPGAPQPKGVRALRVQMHLTGTPAFFSAADRKLSS